MDYKKMWYRMKENLLRELQRREPVSYTHLDVYKRQEDRR